VRVPRDGRTTWVVVGLFFAKALAGRRRTAVGKALAESPSHRQPQRPPRYQGAQPVVYCERMKLRRRPVLAAVVLVAILLAGWLIVLRMRGPLVPVVAVEPQDLVRTMVASGRVIAPEQISIGAVLVGTITKIYVDEGDRVHKNQPLIELDAEMARAEVERARSALAAARAQLREVEDVSADVADANLRHAESALRDAQDTARRAEALAKAGAISFAERDAARRGLEQAETRVQSARAQLESTTQRGSGRQRALAHVEASKANLAAAEARLAETVIPAPTDGVVLRRDVDPGDVARPGARLLEIGASGPPQLLIQPDETNLSALALGQQALASADAYPRQAFAALVAEIAPAVDAQRGSVAVKLDIPTPPPFLRPDMTVSVEVVTGRQNAALAVPLTSIRNEAHDQDRPWVFVIRNGRAAQQPVRLGLEGEDIVQVTAGLKSGDRVVASSEPILRPGQRVRAHD
jgi:HlyD family secretion protein